MRFVWGCGFPQFGKLRILICCIILLKIWNHFLKVGCFSGGETEEWLLPNPATKTFIQFLVPSIETENFAFSPKTVNKSHHTDRMRTLTNHYPSKRPKLEFFCQFQSLSSVESSSVLFAVIWRPTGPLCPLYWTKMGDWLFIPVQPYTQCGIQKYSTPV